MVPRVIDNDRDEVLVVQDGLELRGWSYATDLQRRAKIFAAREFVEGWHHGRDQAAPSRGFWAAFVVLALWASGCLAYGLFLLASSIPQIGAPL